MFKEVELPQQIQEDMEVEKEYIYKDNVLHVSELSYDCMYKQYLDRLHGKEFPQEALYNIYRGVIFDRYITSLFDANEINVQHRIKGTDIVVRGRIDALDRKENIIYELKTTKSIKYVNQPYIHHINQGIFYLSCYDPKATLRFMYLSMDGYKIFEYEGGLDTADSILHSFTDKAIALSTGLKKEIPPEPTKGKECSWCRYKQLNMCPICKPRKYKKRGG